MVGCVGLAAFVLRLRRCGFEAGRSPRGPRPERRGWSWLGSAGRGRVLAHRCVTVAARRVGLRKGLDRRMGLGSAGSAERGHDSSSVRDSRTVLPSRGPCHVKEASWRRKGPRTGSDSPSAWNGQRKGRIPAHPPRTGAPDGRRILPSRAEPRTMLRSRRDPVANAASFAHTRTNAEPCVTPSHAPRAHPTPDPSAGRGPFGEQVHSQPQQRSSRTTTHPQRRSSERRLRRGRSARRAGGRAPACRPAPPRPCPPRAARRRTRRRRGPRRARASPAPRSR